MRRLFSIGFACITLLACGDGFGVRGTSDSGGADSDLGGDTGSVLADGATTDGPMNPPEDDSDAVLARDGTGLAPSFAGAEACYGEAACDPDTCSEVRSCCVGSGTCCAPTGADPAPSLDVSTTCGDFAAAGDCLVPGMTPFGDPLPYVFDGGIVPGGDGDGESGLLADTPVDLTVHQAVVRATIRAPVDCASGCLETVGFGMTTQADVTGAVRVVASLLYSAARDRMTLMIGEAQIATWSGIADGEVWTLELLPSGSIQVLRDGAVPADFEVQPYQPHPSARLVVYGHSLNPTSSSEPTRVESIEIDVSLCDVPDSWTDRGSLAVALPAGGTLAPESDANAPSLLHGARNLLSWEQGGEIWLAEDLGSGFVAQDEPILSASAADTWMNGGVGDPELVERPDGTGYTIFFTARQSGGRPSVGRLDLDTSLEPMMGAVATPVAAGIDVEADEIAQPSVWVRDATTWIMVVRASENGIAHLRALRSDDSGASWYRHRSAALDGLTARSGDRTSSGFNSDDLGHPSLVVHNGAWQLYYAGRRGTRFGVGLLLSDDLVNWRHHAPGIPVLAPGVSEDEQVGVTAPDVVVESFGLSMAYVADDGFERRLYTTSRRATDSGSF